MTLSYLLFFGLSCLATWLGSLHFSHQLKQVNSTDPALPEKLARHRAYISILVFLVLLISLVAGVFLERDQIGGGQFMDPLALPALFFWLAALGIIVMSTGYSNRIRLFEESWNLWAYLGFNLRVVFAFLGYWIFCLVIPPVLLTLGNWGWMVGLACFFFLLQWAVNFPKWFCDLMHAEPLKADPALKEALNKILDRSCVEKVDIQQCGPQKGHWTNAVALPSTKCPIIVFSKPLLKNLSVDEISGIFAHELAHIEDFSKVWLKKAKWMDLLLLTIGFLGMPILYSQLDNGYQWIIWVWIILVTAVYTSRVKDYQQREIFADKRGLELCQNPQAIIAGLTKVYALSRLPRRVQVEMDRKASHPSLARRIQEIRNHAISLGLLSEVSPDDAEATSESATNLPQIFQSVNADNELLLIEAKKVCWITISDNQDLPANGVTVKWIRSHSGIERSTSYSGLIEMRLLFKGGKPILRTIESPRLLREFSIRPEDVGRIQETLNQVDTKIAPIRQINLNHHALPRIAVFGTALSLFFASFQGVATIGTVLYLLIGTLLAMLACNRAWIAGIGGAAGLYALRQLLFATDQSWWSSSAWAFLTLTAVLGGICWIAVFKRDSEKKMYVLPEGNSGPQGSMLLIVSCIIVLPLFLSLRGDNSLLKLSLLADNAHLAFLPFLCAGSCWMVSSKGVTKIAAFACLLVGMAPGFLASEYFRFNIAREPMAAPQAPVVAWNAQKYQPDQSLELPGDYWDIQLAPNGEWLSLQLADPDGHDHDTDSSHGFRISNWNGSTYDYQGAALAWTSDSECLGLKQVGSILQLQRFRPDSPEKLTWSLVLPNLNLSNAYDLKTNGNQWNVITGNGNSGTFLSSGTFSSDKIESHSWFNDDYEDTWRHLAGQNHLLELAWNKSPDHRPAFRKFQKFYYWPTAIRMLDSKGNPYEMATSSLWITANADEKSDSYVMSQGTDQAWLWSPEVNNKLLNPLWQLPPVETWRVKNNILTLLSSKTLYLLNLGSGRGNRLALPQAADWETNSAVGNNHVAIAWPDERGLKVDRIPLNIPE